METIEYDANTTNQSAMPANEATQTIVLFFFRSSVYRFCFISLSHSFQLQVDMDASTEMFLEKLFAFREKRALNDGFEALFANAFPPAIGLEQLVSSKVIVAYISNQLCLLLLC